MVPAKMGDPLADYIQLTPAPYLECGIR